MFHKDCVLAMKDLHPSHLTAIKRANSSVGWSCPSCVRRERERERERDREREQPVQMCKVNRLCLQGKSERNSEELNHVFYYQDDLSLLLREDELKGIIDTFDEEINPKGEYVLCYNYLFPLSWDWGWGLNRILV